MKRTVRNFSKAYSPVFENRTNPKQTIGECFLEFLLDQGVSGICMEILLYNEPFCKYCYNADSHMCNTNYREDILAIMEDIDQVYHDNCDLKHLDSIQFWL